MSDGRLEVGVATAVGPRILALRLVGGDNVLAELGSEGIDLDDGRRFTFYGGHRLWVAPEDPALTYLPDDEPVSIGTGERDMVVSMVSSPIAKSMRVRFEGTAVRVDHTITNHTGGVLELAPWAITQLRTGGVARLPLGSTASDPHGLRPDRVVVAWPYARWHDPGVEFDAAEVRILPGRADATKFGTVVGPDGRLSYEIGGLRFTKRCDSDRRGRYTDLGANGQVYANAAFTELETLGPLERLDPGGSVSHTEWWTLES